MMWFRVTFRRPGWDNASYNVCSLTRDTAWRDAEALHVGRGNWVGMVDIQPIAPPEPDQSFTMDELADRAIDLNSRHDDVPF